MQRIPWLDDHAHRADGTGIELAERAVRAHTMRVHTAGFTGNLTPLALERDCVRQTSSCSKKLCDLSRRANARPSFVAAPSAPHGRDPQL